MTLIIRMKIDDECCVALKIKSIDHVSFDQKGGLVLDILYTLPRVPCNGCNTNYPYNYDVFAFARHVSISFSSYVLNLCYKVLGV